MAKKFIGTVTSDVQDKTIVVTITRRVTHPVYGKQYTVSKKLAVHDATNQAKTGDRVEFTESRPISKRKRFSLLRVLEKAHGKIELKAEEVEKTPVAEKAEAKAEAEK